MCIPANSARATRARLSERTRRRVGIYGFGVLIGLVAGIQVWRSHRRPSVLILFAVGIIGLLSARVLEGGAHHEEHGHELHQEAHEANEVDSNAHDKSNGSHHEKKHSNHHEQKHSDHEESHHLSIELLGILSGLVLMGGHLINLRREKTNSVEEECST